MSRWRSRSFPSMMRITQTPCPKIRWQECSRTSIMAWRYGQSGSVGVGTVASMLTWQLQVEQEEVDTIIDRASQASCMSARGLSGALSDSSCFLTCLRRTRILCIRWLAAPSQGQVLSRRSAFGTPSKMKKWQGKNLSGSSRRCLLVAPCSNCGRVSLRVLFKGLRRPPTDHRRRTPRCVRVTAEPPLLT